MFISPREKPPTTIQHPNVTIFTVSFKIHFQQNVFYPDAKPIKIVIYKGYTETRFFCINTYLEIKIL